MSIIPLKKLIEYKGNRYELSRAMIELAKSGGNLLRNETKYRKGKYIQTVIKNILDGNIKYEYEDDTKMSVDADAPFKSSKSEYDAEAYAIEETKKEEEIEETSAVIYDDDDEEEETPRRRRRRTKNQENSQEDEEE
ncbi:hypothetical protein EPJ64_01810 [Brachyspira aalborgi]|uniref:hypothetical protein n=1 Tax=Brachyspira aalborgi TaxID=29522 RepID=UPI0011C7EAD9|nr:hypothetical protein [Brachyspira aalborgi]TXJ16995.1 hypothetical protein EPJ77_01035 [Brachyspira aalborgi]TXJ22389.1 hypothetical protein EPJ64_01810 [Brachyspira aalborgi]TXJ52362.1 hypothetical protein EPJ75_00295 [Brachyspira aalborgi]